MGCTDIVHPEKERRELMIIAIRPKVKNLEYIFASFFIYPKLSNTSEYF